MSCCGRALRCRRSASLTCARANPTCCTRSSARPAARRHGLYVLLEHQSTPDVWLRLRLLKYSIRIWERDRRRHPKEEQLRLIVPLVLYQGERGWRIACEFSELFAEELRSWPGVPRYEHLLVDQTEAAPDEVRGRVARSHRTTGDDGGVSGELAGVAAFGTPGNRQG